MLKIFGFYGMSNNDSKTEQESIEIDELEQLLLEAEAEEKPVLNSVQSISLTQSSGSASSVKAVVRPTVVSLEGSTFLKELNGSNIPVTNVPTLKKGSSAVHSGDTDSSDDEETRNFLERKYDEYGRGINALLKQKEEERVDLQISNFIDRTLKQAERNVSKISGVKSVVNSKKEPPKEDIKPFPGTVNVALPTPAKTEIPDVFKTGVYTDPVFGIRIVHPLISSTVLQQRMEGRKPISMTKIKYHIEHGNLKDDWAIAGVVLSKSPTKTTSKGGQFAIWKLSDLHGDIKTISLFLFSQAYKDLWKTAEGMVIAILNPGVLERNEDRNVEAVLSIDKSAKVMILGQSRDKGICRSRKKNGERCTAVVNLGKCEYCVYHVKQEYNKASSRGGLTSSTAGRGLQELRNKVLGKNEVFYGGQSFSAVKATKNPKQVEKDKHRMMTLSEYYQSPFQGQQQSTQTPTSVPAYRQQQASKTATAQSKASAARLEINVKQREKDVERLKQLGLAEPSSSSAAVAAPKSTPSGSIAKVEASPAPKLSVPNGFESKKFSLEAKPRLSTGNFVIDLGSSPKQALHSRKKAADLVKSKPLEKANPNFIKYRGSETGKKRALDELSLNEEVDGNCSKKRKLEDEEKSRRERIQKIMDATSSHTDLIKAHEEEQQEKYFNDLERKEAMEEKMLNTFKMACKAVICTQCKYIAFSAADRCKQEQHELKVRDAEKRFFKCGDCGNRTVSLHRIPKFSCKNCQSSRWERCAMLREKRGPEIGNSLSIRGDEEKFLGSCANAANLNLLVPTEDGN
ncbi:protein MCM10 homolog [Uranotaenia lowii]|uniref:protein MCM10 homolog n=1 Tax=Uranotaenia lowii TaxID=190385 RepID=UPI002479AE59|nr:protein MCM10 homolog [Uranotaenia lowii]